MSLDSSHKSAPDYTALFSMIAVFRVTIIEKVGEFGYSLSVKIGLGSRVSGHATVEEYAGPIECCKSRNYFHIQ